MTFKGKLNATEELHGVDECELKIKKIHQNEEIHTYSGGFKDNAFDGLGRLEYHDTGNTFEGNFHRGLKQGAATFELAE